MDEQRKKIIEISNVNRDFIIGASPVRILSEISLEIFEGEFVVIFGPSGCGKSTLLNIIIGLLPSTSGQVIVDGDELSKFNQSEAAQFRLDKFGVIYQRTDWIRGLSVLQNIEVPLAIANMGKKMRLWKAKENLKGVGMEDYEKYDPMNISGGQQQKIALARALVNNPHILVADEPTGNLDSVSANKMMELIDFLHKSIKKTVIMITHDKEVARHASRIISMKDGEIIDSNAQL